jgi:hypothetical protein
MRAACLGIANRVREVEIIAVQSSQLGQLPYQDSVE